MDSSECFPSTWLGADSFKGTKNINLTIETIEREIVGQKKEDKLVIKFVGLDKKLILNKTNWKAICKIVGSEQTEEWEGKLIGIVIVDVPTPDGIKPAIRIVEAHEKGKK